MRIKGLIFSSSISSIYNVSLEHFGDDFQGCILNCSLTIVKDKCSRISYVTESESVKLCVWMKISQMASFNCNLISKCFHVFIRGFKFQISNYQSSINHHTELF